MLEVDIMRDNFRQPKKPLLNIKTAKSPNGNWDGGKYDGMQDKLCKDKYHKAVKRLHLIDRKVSVATA